VSHLLLPKNTSGADPGFLIRNQEKTKTVQKWEKKEFPISTPGHFRGERGWGAPLDPRM